MHPLIVLGTVAAVAYVIACAAWPFVTCQRCDGSGKRRSPSGKTFGNCRRCQGAGRRARVGRRLWAAVTGRGDR